MSEQQFLHFFQRGDDLLSSYGRKIVEELLDRSAVLEIVDEVLRRYASAGGVVRTAPRPVSSLRSE
jgi:hypothetical protein